MIQKSRINKTLKGKFLFLILASNLILAGSVSANPKKEISSKALRSMARVYMAYGEYAKSEPLAEKALNIAKKNEASDEELSWCYIDLATLYKYEGKLDEAENMCKAGLELQKNFMYEKHPYLAYTMRTLSSIYYEQGDLKKADRALDEAIDIMLESHEADNRAIAPFLVDTAKIYVAKGNLEPAEVYYEKAMGLINEWYGSEHLYTAQVLSNISELYILQEKYPDAENLIDEALVVQEKIYGHDHPLVASSWLTKARICQIKGDFAEAEKLIDRAMSAIEKSGNASAFMKLQQDAKQMRAVKEITITQVAKVIEK